MSEIRLSFVIPARNEEALIGEVLEAILASVARASGFSRKDLWLPDTSFEVIVADDGSEDATPGIVAAFAEAAGVRLIPCVGRKSAAARNAGVAASSGQLLCFVDADTMVPETAVDRILELHEDEGRCLVLYRLGSREPAIRAVQDSQVRVERQVAKARERGRPITPPAFLRWLTRIPAVRGRSARRNAYGPNPPSLSPALLASASRAGG